MTKKIRILYVDDNPLDRSLVRDALELEHGGFILTEADSQTSFESIIAHQTFDVVLSDFNILGYEGLEVLETISKIWPDIPVIIVTGTGTELIAIESIKRGAADYVIKSHQHIRRLPATIMTALKVKKAEISRRQAAVEMREKSLALEKQLRKSEENRIANLVVLKDLNRTTKKLKSEIEERTKLESELRQREEALNSIINNPEDYLIYRLKASKSSLSPVVTHVSPSVIKIVGISEKDLYNYPVWFVNIHPDDLRRVLAANDRGMKPPFVFQEEFRFMHPDKGEIWLQIRSSGVPYADDPENIEFAHGIVIDITERKKLELRQKILYDISNAVIRIDRLSELYATIHKLIGTIIDATNFFIALVDNEKKAITFPYYSDENDAALQELPLDEISGFCNVVLKTRKPLLARNPEMEKMVQDGEVRLIGTVPQCWLGVPLKAKKQIYGVLAVQSYQDAHRYSEADVELLSFVSEEIVNTVLRVQHETQIHNNLREKETLIQELFHRTKNNMQVVSSLIRMQERKAENRLVKQTLSVLNNRIKSMSLVHKSLYKNQDLSRVRMRKYLINLYGMLKRNYSSLSSKITSDFHLEDVQVSIDAAVPLGLVANELITNIFQHAFVEGETGKISINIYRDSENALVFLCGDNGKGLEGDLRKRDSMGLKNIFNLVEHQLQGKIEYRSLNGLQWHIEIHDDVHRKRM